MSTIFAQKGNLKGILLDSETNMEIPFASIVVKDALTSETISGTTSNENGAFEINHLKFGTFNIEFSFLGYETSSLKNITLSKSNSKIDVGNVLLKTSTESLSEVKIKATSKTQTTKIDKKTYNVADFETAKGGNAADVLNKIPSVSVGSDGSVSVRGTTDFMVYLNGKPTQIDPSTLLSQISSNSIDKIDVISVPTARYDAQGKGGIINISTKSKGMEGLSVAANGFLGGSPWGNVTDKYSDYNLSNDRYGAGFNLIYNTKKVSLFADFNYNKKNVNGKRSGDARVLVKYPEGDYFHMVAAGERPEWYEYYSANLGADFNLNDNQVLSLSYFYGNRNNGRAAYYIYNNYYADADKSNKDETLEEWIYNPNIDNRYGKYHTFNADYQLDFNEEDYIKASASFEKSDLSRSLSNKNYAYNPLTDTASSTVDQQYSLSDDTPLSGLRFSFDYAKKVKENHYLGLGFQIKHVNISGDFEFDNDLVEKDLDNSIELNRNVYAAYADFSGSAHKFNYILGLRAEYGDQEMDVANTDYLSLFGNVGQSTYTDKKFNLFPSAHLEYGFSEKNNLILAASRRINRPSVTNLAPFLYRRHYEVYVLGDPALESEYLNNVELTYETKVKNHSFNLTGFYRGTENAVFRVNTTTTAIENPEVFDILQENVLIRSYTNAGNSTSLGMELNANIKAGNFAKFFLGGSLYQYKIKGDVFGYEVDNSSTNWSLKGNVLMNFTDDLSFNFDYNIKSATVTSQGSNDAYSVANVAFNYKPKKLNGWDFSLRGLDIFGSNLEGLDTNAYNSSNEQIFYQETLYTRNGPVVEIGVNYTINMKGKSKKATKVSAEEHFK